VADLATFAVAAAQIRMDDQPSQVVAPSKGPSVYVLTPASGSVHEIAVQQLKSNVSGPGQTAVSMQLSPDEKDALCADGKSEKAGSHSPGSIFRGLGDRSADERDQF